MNLVTDAEDEYSRYDSHVVFEVDDALRLEELEPPSIDVSALNGLNYGTYYEIWDEDEIVLDGHFTYAALKAIMDAWEEYRQAKSK